MTLAICRGTLDFVILTLDDCLKAQHPDTILLCSSIQYLEKPYELLSQVKKDFNYLVFDKTPFLEKGEDTITVHVVSPDIYDASIPTWLFNLDKFMNFFSDKFELIADYDNFAQIVNNRITINWKGFIFVKKE